MVEKEIPVNEQLIKSKHRVRAHGEVFTPRWMVDFMLDTPGVKEACENIDATFLEPAAGDGNFLIAILERKLQSLTDLEIGGLAKLESLWALASIYGIELLEDNHELAQARVLLCFRSWWKENFGSKIDLESDFYKSAEFIVRKNIVRGNALTSKNPDTGEEIVFYDWQRQANSMKIGYLINRFIDISDEKAQAGEYGMFDENFNIIEGETLAIADLLKLHEQGE